MQFQVVLLCEVGLACNKFSGGDLAPSTFQILNIAFLQNSDVLTSLWSVPHSLCHIPPPLHHFATTLATFCELLWGLPPATCGAHGLCQRWSFSTAGARRPGFRSPGNVFLYWSLGLGCSTPRRPLAIYFCAWACPRVQSSRLMWRGI